MCDDESRRLEGAIISNVFHQQPLLFFQWQWATCLRVHPGAAAEAWAGADALLFPCITLHDALAWLLFASITASYSM
jgi:hypothetical protein